MKLDINEIYHQYITRVVIFSLFTYKRLVKQPSVYRLSVRAFVKKRLPWDINLEIDMGVQLDKEDQRDIVLEEVLNNVESDYMTTVTVSFTTPMRDVSMMID